jgi:tRNA G46 methylase TrmB
LPVLKPKAQIKHEARLVSQEVVHKYVRPLKPHGHARLNTQSEFNQVPRNFEKFALDMVQDMSTARQDLVDGFQQVKAALKR